MSGCPSDQRHERHEWHDLTLVYSWYRGQHGWSWWLSFLGKFEIESLVYCFIETI
jgi:hypothetical protein